VTGKERRKSDRKREEDEVGDEDKYDDNMI